MAAIWSEILHAFTAALHFCLDGQVFVYIQVQSNGFYVDSVDNLSLTPRLSNSSLLQVELDPNAMLSHFRAVLQFGIWVACTQ